MKVVKQEVKTFYTIEITVEDFRKIIVGWWACGDKHYTPRAFEFIEIDENPQKWEEAKLLEILRNQLFVSGNSDTYSYIARFYGFDGWKNVGYWKEHKQCWTMELYNSGEYLK